MTDLEKIRKLMRDSGNSFHCRVAGALQAEGWETQISPYYTDSATDKPREIDLIAEKSFRVSGGASRQSGEYLIRLFVECKYIKQDTVFWFEEIDAQRVEELLIRRTPCKKNNKYTQRHHYLSNKRAAKLFHSGKQSTAEHDPIFKALNQSLSALIYYRASSRTFNPVPKRRPQTLRRVEYPVILCNSFDKFWSTTIGENGDPSKLSENFLLEVSYAYVGREKTFQQEYFLIDVVSYDALDLYLASLIDEAEAMHAFFP